MKRSLMMELLLGDELAAQVYAEAATTTDPDFEARLGREMRGSMQQFAHKHMTHRTGFFRAGSRSPQPLSGTAVTPTGKDNTS